MRGSRAGSVVLGLGWLALIVIVYPTVLPAVESFVDEMLGVTSVASGFDYFIISTLPLWGLLVGVAGAVLIITKGGKGGS